MSSREQRIIDAFYKSHGPCCAGCDWWRWNNSVSGDCTRSSPVSGKERFAMTGMTGARLEAEAGHIVTWRNHVCGEFKDSPERWEAA